MPHAKAQSSAYGSRAESRFFRAFDGVAGAGLPAHVSQTFGAMLASLAAVSGSRSGSVSRPIGFPHLVQLVVVIRLESPAKGSDLGRGDGVTYRTSARVTRGLGPVAAVEKA